MWVSLLVCILIIVLAFFIWILLSDEPRNNVVFTSFGDNHNIDKYWDSHPTQKSFDILGAYYGDRERPPARKTTFSKIYKRKGGKFQNFCYFYKRFPNLFKKYKYVAIWDDDIIIDTLKINEMFRIMGVYGLKVGMPSFSQEGKISHWITRHQPDRLLTFTNFIEMNVPIFHHSVLPLITRQESLSVCELTGYGIDHIYMNLLNEQKFRFAVVHSVICINPKELEKTDQRREIDKLQPMHQRKKAYEEIRDKTGIRDVTLREYETIYRRRR